MPLTYRLQRATRLKLELRTDNKIGVGRAGGCELIPNTPSACKRLGFEVTTEQFRNDFNLDLLKDLRAYQKEDAIFLAQRKNAGCFNQQRTGKTPTSLLSLKLKGCKKVLIVCPASMVPVWKSEFEQWYGEPCIALQGTKTKRLKLLETWTDGLVIGYECLRIVDHYDKTTGEYTHSTGDLADILAHKDIDAVVLDEAHRIRNYKNKTAEAAFKLKDVPNKLALTGTPTLKKQEEIYSILHFLYPSLFKSYWRFIDYYFIKEYREIWNGRRAIQTTEIGPLRRPEELQEFLDLISTQRKRIEVMPWLPNKDKQTIYLEPTEHQARYIKELKEFFETGDVTTVGTLDTLLRERQICLSPALLSLGDTTSPKYNWIQQYLNDYPEKQVIIFSKFTQWLKLLHEKIEDSDIFVGETTSKQREKLKKDFQAGKLRVLLIQIDAGKEGLTLDSADTIIFTDKFPPVGDIEQAEDRFVATSKDRVKKEQTIYSLVMNNTYEKNIEKSLNRSSSELDLINDYQKYLKGE